MDSALAQKITEYEPEFWDFSKYRNSSPIIQYPATMVAPMQDQLLSDILQDDSSIVSIMDPFVGSGTIMEIGYKLGLKKLYGIDINPLAAIITEVRLTKYTKEELNVAMQRLSQNLSFWLGNVPFVFFKDITKWFRLDIIQALSLLKFCIEKEPNSSIRKLFWVCFSDIVRKVSNTRSSTFKLHTKTTEVIQAIDNNCIEAFQKKIRSYSNNEIMQENKSVSFDLKCGDSYSILKEMSTNSLDLICTSPPYGDNMTTVTYGQFSILPLRWINRNDLPSFPDDFLEKNCAIDSHSLGGSIKKTLEEYSSIEFMCYDLIDGISKEKQKKIKAFFFDYYKVFCELSRILKPNKRLVLTLGNRRVDNQEVLFTVFNDRLATYNNLELETEFSRAIQGKRMPSRVSQLPNIGSVESMKNEYIKIYRKRKN